jgi:hypothetical protein
MNPRFRDLMRSIEKKVDAELPKVIDPTRAEPVPLKIAVSSPSPPSNSAVNSALKPAIKVGATKAEIPQADGKRTPNDGELGAPIEARRSRFMTLPKAKGRVPMMDGEEQISIGLDWGTHSTKVVIRRGDQELSELLIMERAPDNDRKFPPLFLDSPYPYFAIPSVVGIDSGTFRFGDSARSLKIAQRCYCLKASLFKGQPSVPPALVKALGETAEADAVDLLAAAFLGWVLGRARESIDKLVGVGNWNPFVAICAPMDRTEDAELKRRYEMILHAAVLAAFRTDGALFSSSRSVAEAVRTLEGYLTTEAPAAHLRCFVVAPETVAGLIPLQADPRYSSGLYSLVDIGGGSTELAIVHIVKTGAGSIDCLADHSIPIGTLDLNEHRAVPGGYSPKDSLAKHASDMWANCYVSEFRRYGNSRGWKKTLVIKAGGGWRFEDLELLLRSRHASNEYAKVGGEVAEFNFVEYAPSTNIIKTAPTIYAPTTERREQFRFLPVAIGLSRYLIWPKNWGPEDRPPSVTRDEPPPQPEATHGHN